VRPATNKLSERIAANRKEDKKLSKKVDKLAAKVKNVKTERVVHRQHLQFGQCSTKYLSAIRDPFSSAAFRSCVPAGDVRESAKYSCQANKTVSLPTTGTGGQLAVWLNPSVAKDAPYGWYSTYSGDNIDNKSLASLMPTISTTAATGSLALTAGATAASAPISHTLTLNEFYNIYQNGTLYYIAPNGTITTTQPATYSATFGGSGAMSSLNTLFSNSSAVPLYVDAVSSQSLTTELVPADITRHPTVQSRIVSSGLSLKNITANSVRGGKAYGYVHPIYDSLSNDKLSSYTGNRAFHMSSANRRECMFPIFAHKESQRQYSYENTNEMYVQLKGIADANMADINRTVCYPYCNESISKTKADTVVTVTNTITLTFDFSMFAAPLAYMYFIVPYGSSMPAPQYDFKYIVHMESIGGTYDSMLTETHKDDVGLSIIDTAAASAHANAVSSPFNFDSNVTQALRKSARQITRA